MPRRKRKNKPHKNNRTKKQPPPAPPPPPIAVVNPTDPPIGNGGGNGDGERNGGEQHPRARRTVNLDRWYAVALLLATAVASVFAGFQWWTMGNQTTEMVKQNAVMIDQNCLIQQELAQAKAANEVARKATEQTERVIERMKFDQRAWLSISDSTLDPLEEGKPMVVRFVVRNTGLTPATITESTLDPHMVINDEEIDDLMGEKSRLVHLPIEAQASIAPGDELRVVRTHEDILNDLHVTVVNNGGLVILFAGTLTYKDAIGHIGHTSICYTYDRKTKRLIRHQKYNYMD